MKTQDVKDRPAERGINITNILLSLLILLGGVFGTSVTTSMENINTAVLSVERSVNNLNVDAGKMGVKIENLNKAVEVIGDRVNKLEGKHFK